MSDEVIKILHVGLSKNPGGVESFVYNYNKVISKEFRFDYIDLYGDGIANEDGICKLGGKILTLQNYKKFPLSAFIKYIKYLIKYKYDIIHIHMQSAANILLPIISLFFCKNVICHSHSSSTSRELFRKILDFINKYILRMLPVKKWACGKRAGEWMWGDFFENCNIIYNAVDVQKIHFSIEKRNFIREKMGINSDDIVIGYVGKFAWEKNVFFLLQILEKLHAISNKYKLLTVGGNELFNDFLSIVKDKNLENCCINAGIQKDVSPYYCAMDYFLLPSFFEGFPIVAVEAQISGLPCFFSDRITKEIDFTENNAFISIDNCHIQQWIEHIINSNKNLEREKIKFPNELDIKNSVIKLENKYKSMLSN